MKTIPLTQGKVALVDDADYKAVMQYKWYAMKGKAGVWYAAHDGRKSDGTGSTLLLHRFLMPGVPMIDHWDGDGLNNQRENLRPCTYSQNNANKKSCKEGTSNFLGVCWKLDRGKWLARLDVGGKSHHLGYFSSEEEAARAYDAAARKFHREFARLNFP